MRNRTVKKLLLIGSRHCAGSARAIRWLYYYEGDMSHVVARPDLTQVQVPGSAEPFEDITPTAAGTILVDLAHGNRFAMTELNVRNPGHRGSVLRLSCEDLRKQPGMPAR
jgi:hypothetical protein